MITETYTVTWTKRGTKPFACALSMSMSNGRMRYRSCGKIKPESIISLGLLASVTAENAEWQQRIKEMAKFESTAVGKA